MLAFLLCSDIKGTELPPANILIPVERQLIALQLNFAAESFYIMKLCSRLFVLYCRNCPKDDKFRYFIPHFEEVRGGVEQLVDGSLESPCRVLVKCRPYLDFFFYLLRLKRYKEKGAIKRG